jgi:hypothetical protein
MYSHLVWREHCSVYWSRIDNYIWHFKNQFLRYFTKNYSQKCRIFIVNWFMRSLCIAILWSIDGNIRVWTWIFKRHWFMCWMEKCELSSCFVYFSESFMLCLCNFFNGNEIFWHQHVSIEYIFNVFTTNDFLFRIF